MLRSAPVAFRCTRISLERARRVRGTRAPDLAIFVLLSSTPTTCEHQLKMGKENIHTMSCQVCDAADSVTLHLHIRTQHLSDERFQSAEFHNEKLIIRYKNPTWHRSTPRRKANVDFDVLLTAKLPNAALAARCTSVSWLLSRNRMGSSVSRLTACTSFSVISAKARAALRWRSTLSEKESVVSAERGEPSKKLVVVRSGLP